ncbi:MAG: rRNA pseudouridine synthase [Epsilonproteobacteria bacterium]|nr:rRNA pseudouridine synthase [Campylobacterota bacterium]
MEKIRLNKMISHNTKYSRREADELIKNGDIKVDGKVVTDLSTKVDFDNKIHIKGRRLYKKDHFTVIVYHKQKGELVTKKDDRGRKTIFDTLPKKYAHFLPVGRLDFASEGLLLLTDSPQVATKLMKSNLERVYYLKIKGFVTPAMEEGMKNGVLIPSNVGGHKDSDIESMQIAPFLAYKIIKNSPTFSKLKVAINEGKNRELRRFFAFYDSEVTDLKRVSFGGIELGTLKPGKSRYLEKNEYQSLHDFLHKK